jgi:hypothetical protein
MRLYNTILFLGLSMLAGCGPVYSQVRTRAVRSEATPFTLSVDSDGPADSCEVRRRSQRIEQLAMYCRSGVAEACPAPDTEPRVVDYRAAVEAVCVGGALDEATCDQLRTALPPGATVESTAPTAPPAAVTTASQLLAYRYLNDPIVWGDVEMLCSGRSMGYAYGGLGYGGYGYGGGFLPPTVGYVGSGVGTYAAPPIVVGR